MSDQPPTEAETDPPDDSLRSRLRPVWTIVLRAMDAGKLYDLDHPVVVEQTEEAAAALAACRLPSPCTLLVEPEAILPLDELAAAGGPDAEQPDHSEGRLAEMLHQLDVGAIRFAVLPRPEDLCAFVSAVAAIRPGQTWADTLGTVSSRTDGRLDLEPLDLGALTAAAPDNTQEGEEVLDWSSLVACLIHADPTASQGESAAQGEDAAQGEGATPRTAPAPGAGMAREAAASIAQRMIQDPQLGAPMLRKRLREAGELVGEGDPATARERLGRLQDFTKELSGILGGDTGGGPAGDSGNGPQHGAAVVRQSLLMCRALSNFDPDAAARAAGPGEEWTDAVRDLLVKDTNDEHTPAEYMHRLEALAARQDASMAAPSGEAREAVACLVNEEAFAPTAVTEHLLLLMLEVAEGRTTDPSPTEADADPALQHLARRLPELLKKGQWEVLGRIHRLLGGEAGSGGPCVLTGAWTEHVLTLAAGHRVAEAIRGGEDPAPALHLLRMAGPEAFRGFVDAAADGAPGSPSLLRHLDPETLGELRGDWLAGHPAAAGMLTEAMAPLSFEDARALLAGELVQRDSARRFAGFRSLLKASDELDPAFLLSLLPDPDPRIARLAVGMLLGNDPRVAGGFDALVGWLQEQNPRREPAYRAVLTTLSGDARGQGILHHLLSPHSGAGAIDQRRRLFVVSTLGELPSLPPTLAAAVEAAGADRGTGLGGRLLKLVNRTPSSRTASTPRHDAA